jgi:uncharacterized protein (TIGR02145 family)
MAFAQQKGTFTNPRDGKKYKTVKIGEQVWMAENLNYNAEGSKCYNNKTKNCDKYGRMYNWATAMKSCPSDWHLPDMADWDKLDNYVKSKKSCTECAGKYLKAKSGWNWDKKKGKSGNGTDSYGFSALPGGLGSYKYGNFFDAGIDGYWWSSSRNSHGSNIRHMGYNHKYLAFGSHNEMEYLQSVRCLND